MQQLPSGRKSSTGTPCPHLDAGRDDEVHRPDPLQGRGQTWFREASTPHSFAWQQNPQHQNCTQKIITYKCEYGTSAANAGRARSCPTAHLYSGSTTILQQVHQLARVQAAPPKQRLQSVLCPAALRPADAREGAHEVAAARAASASPAISDAIHVAAVFACIKPAISLCQAPNHTPELNTANPTHVHSPSAGPPAARGRPAPLSRCGPPCPPCAPCVRSCRCCRRTVRQERRLDSALRPVWADVPCQDVCPQRQLHWVGILANIPKHSCGLSHACTTDQLLAPVKGVLNGHAVVVPIPALVPQPPRPRVDAHAAQHAAAQGRQVRQ